jgi:hypothetical protein
MLQQPLVRPPRRLEGIDSLHQVLERLAEGTPKESDPANLRELRRQYDVTLIPRPPTSVASASPAQLAPTAPLIAAILAGHVDRLETHGRDHWLLLRKPAGSATTLQQAFSESPASAPALLTAVLQAMVALHERGVILNRGARSALQSVSRDGRSLVVGWHTEWATVFGRAPGQAALRVICATDDDDDEEEAGAGTSEAACSANAYPARDLLWLLSDAPAAVQRLAGSVVTCVVLALRGNGSKALTYLCALVPLSELMGPGGLRLPAGWQASATPVGGMGVVVAQGHEAAPPLHRAAWAIQKVAASGLAVHDNGSSWARRDLQEAVAELWRESREIAGGPSSSSAASARLIVLRGIGSRRVAVFVGGEEEEGERTRSAWEQIQPAETSPLVTVKYTGPVPAEAAAVPRPPIPMSGTLPSPASSPLPLLTELVREAQAGPDAPLASVLEFFGSIDAPDDDGESEDGEQAGGESEDGEQAGGESEDGEQAGGESEDGEQPGGESEDGEQAGGESEAGLRSAAELSRRARA